VIAMSKPSAEDIERSRRETCETIRRVDQMFTQPVGEQKHEPDPADDALAQALAQPVESINMRHRREITQQEQEFEIEREREHVRQERTRIAANAAAEQRIAELEAELAELARATSTVADAFEHELSYVTSENRELKLSQARLETRLAELQLQVTESSASDRGNKIINLPPLPSVN
jgi:hypothetical protein